MRTVQIFSERKQRIFDFLLANPVGVLSTIDMQGKPHGVVVYYLVHRDFSVSFLTKKDTLKYENLKNDGNVMLTVFEQRNQVTAQITGRAVEIKDSYGVNRVAAAVLAASLKTSDAGIPPIVKLNAGDAVAFTIKPEQIRLAVYARPDSGDASELFESLESFELNT